MTDRGEEKLFKVAFDLPEVDDSWPPIAVEQLWAAKTPVKFQLEVRNIPFFVRGVSFGDTVRVRIDNERREFVFEELVSESGYSTVRVVLMSDAAKPSIDQMIGDTQLDWESKDEGLYALSVPPEADYAAIRSRLLQLKADGLIDVEEGAIASGHQAQLPSFP